MKTLSKISLLVVSIVTFSHLCFAETYSIKDGQDNIANRDKVIIYTTAVHKEITMNKLDEKIGLLQERSREYQDAANELIDKRNQITTDTGLS